MLNCFVADKNGTLDILLGDWEHQLSYPFWGKRIRGNTSGFRIDRPAGFERLVKSGRRHRLNRNQLYPAAVPSRDSADETASADSDEKRIQIIGLLLQLQRDSSLALERFDLIVRMDGKRSTFRGPNFAGGQSIGVALACDADVSAIFT